MHKDLVKTAFMMGFLEKKSVWPFSSEQKISHGVPASMSEASPEERLKYLQSQPKESYGLGSIAETASSVAEKATSPLSSLGSSLGSGITKELSSYVKNQLPQDLTPVLDKARAALSKEIQTAVGPKGAISKFVSGIGQKAFPYALGMMAGPPIIQTLLSQLFPSGGGGGTMPIQSMSPPHGMMQQRRAPVAARFKSPQGYY